MKEKNSKWPEIVLRKMEKYRKTMYDAEKYIWTHPQTGFKEWVANDYLKEKYTALGFKPIEAGNIPGFFFDIDTGKEGPTLAILAEMDSADKKFLGKQCAGSQISSKDLKKHTVVFTVGEGVAKITPCFMAAKNKSITIESILIEAVR